MLFPDNLDFVQVRDGNPIALRLFERHYSKYHYKDGRKPKLFVGPGHKVVLLSKDGKALFVWRKFISGDGQKGVNCSVFRNEGELLSSDLIRQAEKIAWNKWPGERLYTYINSSKIKSANPGYCFKKAGWVICGITKVNKLLILERTQTAEEIAEILFW